MTGDQGSDGWLRCRIQHVPISAGLRCLAAPYPRHAKQLSGQAVALALHTGQRSSDLIKIRWDDYDASAIQVTQKSTATRLWVPCRADLKVELTEWKRNATSVTVLIDPASEQPWNRIGFSKAVDLAIKAHPEPTGYVFPRLAESLCPAAGGGRLSGPGDRGHHRAHDTERARNSHRSGGPATMDGRRRREAGKTPAEYTGKFGR